MWLTGYIAKENSPKSKCGEVVRSEDNTVNVFSSVEQSNVKVALPYGLYSVPQIGDNSVIIPTENGNVVVGVCNNNSHNLEVGEVLLCSAGGAKILLNNKGQVLINGKVISWCMI